MGESKKKKEKAKLRKYCRLVYPKEYVKDLVGKKNGK